MKKYGVGRGGGADKKKKKKKKKKKNQLLERDLHIEKVIDVTYEVSCGHRGKPQAIHVDRMKAKRPQQLALESKDRDVQCSPQNKNDEVIIDMGDIGEEEHVGQRDDSLTPSTSRTRRPPPWMSDYITKL